MHKKMSLLASDRQPFIMFASLQKAWASGPLHMWRLLIDHTPWNWENVYLNKSLNNETWKEHVLHKKLKEKDEV